MEGPTTGYLGAGQTLPATGSVSVRISTDAMPERLAYFREEVARSLVRVDIQPLGERPFQVEATMRALPGLRTLDLRTSGMRIERTRALIPPDEDMFGLVIMRDDHSQFTQFGREITVGPGEAVVISHFDPAALIHSCGRHDGGVFSLAAIAPLVRDLENAYARLIPRGNEALQLLAKYLLILKNGAPLATPELAHSIATHINDLVALAIGATRDGAELASGRGVRAARLRAVKANILANLASFELSETTVAMREGVTPRYVRMLFETEGTSFSQFVLGARLAAAHRMLADPRQDHLTITAIAYAAGFGDLSYFNHVFRRRYGATPSEIRAAQLGSSSGQQ
jgi:AraC-like DNA-binding protein